MGTSSRTWNTLATSCARAFNGSLDGSDSKLNKNRSQERRGSSLNTRQHLYGKGHSDQRFCGPAPLEKSRGAPQCGEFWEYMALGGAGGVGGPGNAVPLAVAPVEGRMEHHQGDGCKVRGQQGAGEDLLRGIPCNLWRTGQGLTGAPDGAPDPGGSAAGPSDRPAVSRLLDEGKAWLRLVAGTSTAGLKTMLPMTGPV